MSGRDSVLKNTLAMLAVRVLVPIMAFVLFVYVSRKLGPVELGKYGLILAVYQIVQQLPLLGLGTYVGREVARDRSLLPVFMRQGLLLAFVGSLVTSAVLYTCVAILRYPPDVLQAFFILSIAVIAGSSALLCECVIVGCERIPFITKVTTIENVLRTGISFAALWMGYGVVSLILILGLTRAVSLFLYMGIIDQLQGKRTPFRFEASSLIELLKTSRIFFGITIFSLLLSRMSVIAVSRLCGFEETGFFMAPYRILDICSLIISTVMVAAFPTLCRLHREAAEKARGMSEKYVRYLVMLGTGIAMVFFVFAEPITVLLFSSAYFPSILAMKLLILSLVFASADQVLSVTLLATDQQKNELRVSAVSFACCLVLLVVLIRLFDFYGASLAVLIISVFQLSLRYFYLKRQGFRFFILRNSGRVLLAGVLAGAFGSLHWPGPWMLICALSVLFYLALIFAFRLVKKQDLQDLFLSKPDAPAEVL